ncbi:membrane protein [Pseudonocardia yuanmonensis]|uniref:Membrane protein n=1 Tax=Pseudonocardia yuanmonensis TaxID=1095914 RepID=A0ABP8X8P3_9PSEU
MTAVLLSVHVLAAIVVVGPVTMATSMFPRYARAALAGDGSPTPVALLHRVSRVYAVLAVAVPFFGLATAVAMGVLGDAWLIASLVLTAAAAALLGLGILPAQATVVAALAGELRPGVERTARILPMTSGVFAVLWAVVVVLMIVRPGSTTGV